MQSDERQWSFVSMDRKKFHRIVTFNSNLVKRKLFVTAGDMLEDDREFKTVYVWAIYSTSTFAVDIYTRWFLLSSTAYSAVNSGLLVPGGRWRLLPASHWQFNHNETNHHVVTGSRLGFLSSHWQFSNTKDSWIKARFVSCSFCGKFIWLPPPWVGTVNSRWVGQASKLALVFH